MPLHAPDEGDTAHLKEDFNTPKGEAQSAPQSPALPLGNRACRKAANVRGKDVLKTARASHQQIYGFLRFLAEKAARER